MRVVSGSLPVKVQTFGENSFGEAMQLEETENIV